MRLFLGIPLPQSTIEPLQQAVAELRHSTNALRWILPENWHITLQFLGEVTAEQGASVRQAVRGISAAPFLVQFGDLGSFERTGILYAGILASPSLAALQRKIVESSARAGIQAQESGQKLRSYTPHLTLARGRSRGGMPFGASGLPPTRGIEGFLATEFCLYQSFLEAAGARYKVLERYPLRTNEG